MNDAPAIPANLGNANIMHALEYVVYPFVMWTSKSPNGEYNRKGIPILLAESTVLCSNVLLCNLYYTMLKIILA